MKSLGGKKKKKPFPNFPTHCEQNQKNHRTKLKKLCGENSNELLQAQWCPDKRQMANEQGEANTLALHYTPSENPREACWGRVWRTEFECWVPREAINAHSDTTVSTFAGPGTCTIRSWWSLNVIFVWQKVALGCLWHERRIKNDAQKTGIKSKRSVCQAQA